MSICITSKRTFKQFWPIFLGGMIGGALTIFALGDLLHLAIAAFGSALVAGVVILWVWQGSKFGDNLFISFLSAGFSAQLLIYAITLILYKVYGDVPLDDPKLPFFIDNSMFFQWYEPLYTLAAYPAMLWLYEYAKIQMNPASVNAEKNNN